MTHSNTNNDLRGTYLGIRVYNVYIPLYLVFNEQFRNETNSGCKYMCIGITSAKRLWGDCLLVYILTLCWY